MVNVSGPLKIMTDKASRVSEVWVGSPQTRPHGGGLLVEERDKVTPVGGVLSFTSLPGPVLLTLVSGGRTLRHVKGIVPDKASATLAEVLVPEHEWAPEQKTMFEQWVSQAKAAEAAAKTQAVAAAGSATTATIQANRSEAEADRSEYWANETQQTVTGDFATHNYVDGKVANHDHPSSEISDAIRYVGADMLPDRVVKTNLDGMLHVTPAPTSGGHVTNQNYVNSGDAATLQSAKNYADAKLASQTASGTGWAALKIGPIVEVRFNGYSGTGGTLPAAFRPSNTVTVPYHSADPVSRIDIRATGAMEKTPAGGSSVYVNCVYLATP